MTLVKSLLPGCKLHYFPALTANAESTLLVVYTPLKMAFISPILSFGGFGHFGDVKIALNRLETLLQKPETVRLRLCPQAISLGIKCGEA